jgi:hypothetical protein
LPGEFFPALLNHHFQGVLTAKFSQRESRSDLTAGLFIAVNFGTEVAVGLTVSGEPGNTLSRSVVNTFVT